MQGKDGKRLETLQYIEGMKPLINTYERQSDLFKMELDRLVDTRHGLVRLAATVDWSRMEELFGKTYCPDNGRPGIPTRLMIGLHYLKYTYNLSDEAVVEGWMENPYWQYFSGEQFFTHDRPIEPSSMSRWRHRIGEAGAEELLEETIKSEHRMDRNQLKGKDGDCFNAILSAAGMNFHKLLKHAAVFWRKLFCAPKDTSFLPSCLWALEAGTPGV